MATIIPHRIGLIDAAKGIGIIFVVIGHVAETITCPMLHKWIYSFHMPFFFFLAGCTLFKSKNSGVLELAKFKSRSLLVPYLFFAMISLPVCYYGIAKGVWNPPSLLTPIVGIVVAKNINSYLLINPPLWFLPCLFVSTLIFYTFIKGQRKIFAISALAIFSFIGFHLPVNFLPLGLDTAFIAVGFIGLGYLAFKYNAIRLFKNKSTLVLFCFFVVLASINILVAIHFNGEVDISSNKYGEFFPFYLSSVCGIFAFSIAGKLLDSNKFLLYIGRNSLIILCTHMIALRAVKMLMVKINLNQFNEYVSMVVVTIIIFTDTVPFIFIINNYFPFLLQRKIVVK
jgi:fucose 4-O-acetylase-like acetyltransferase